MILRNVYRQCECVTLWSARGGRGSAGVARPSVLQISQAGYLCFWHGARSPSPVLPVVQAVRTRCLSDKNQALQRHVFCTAVGGIALYTKTKSSKSAVADTLEEECSFEEVEFAVDSYWQDKKDNEFEGSRNKVPVSEAVIQEINSLFDINRDEALLMLHPFQFQQKISEKDILKTLHFLKDHSITSQQIQRMPRMLLHSEDSLQPKFLKLTEPHLFQNCSEGLGFCHFPIERITKYQRGFMLEAANFPNHKNRIYYLAEKLKLPVECLTEKIVKPRRILSMEVKRLEHMIDIFHGYGMHSEDILADMWVFTYSAEQAEKRLQHVVDLGCQVLKPWMCRCSSYTFDRYCERYHTGKLLYSKHKDIKEYLSEKLQCEPELVDKIFRSNSVLKKVHVTKFQRVFDLLYSEGLTPNEVRSCMKVFQYSEERTAERIRELKQIGYFPFPMIILSKTPRQFRNIVAQYKNRCDLQEH